MTPRGFPFAMDRPEADKRYWSGPRLVVAVLACGAVLPLGIIGAHRAKVAVLTRTQADDVLDEMAWSIPRDQPLSALFDLEGLTIPVEQILPGGPPKDGIPALVDPVVVPVEDAELADSDRVVGVTIGAFARAYPIRVLNYHEAVNDALADVPIGVVFCPLCDSVTVVDRRIDGRTVELGISGLLYNSNVLLYDRHDQSLWSQVGFTAVSGPLAGQTLRHLHGWEMTSFGDWRRRHPGSTVLSTATGHERDYGSSPYDEYLATEKLMFPVPELDRRLPAKAVVIGVRVGGVARAYPLQTFLSAGVTRVEDDLGGALLRIEHDPTTGRTAVVDAPDEAQVVHTFWFTWAAFHPRTEIWTGG